MATNPSKQEPSIEEITRVVYKRFWTLATILTVVNLLIAIGGKQLVEYSFKNYMESKLSDWDKVIDQAKADAKAASQLAKNANETASRAVVTADNANGTVDTAKLKVDALAKRLDHFDAQLTELSDLGLQINKAKMALGEYKALQKQIIDFKVLSTTLDPRLTQLEGKTGQLSVRHGDNALTITLGNKKMYFQHDGNVIITGKDGKRLFHTDTWQPDR